MKIGLLLCLALLLGGRLFAGQPIHFPYQEPTNYWEYIYYPWTGAPLFLVTSEQEAKQVSSGLELVIMSIPQGFQFFKTNAITARLYRANGEVVEPTAEGKELLNAPYYVSTFSSPGKDPWPDVMTFFPWGPNVLEESWIEVSIGADRYWVEIPYGFDRDPRDLPVPSIHAGRAKFVPPIKFFSGHDHVKTWGHVQYDLGPIQNGWLLSLIQSNSVTPECKVVLNIDSHKAAKSFWGSDSPRVTAQIEDDNGTVLPGRRVDTRPDDIGVGTFQFTGYGNDSRNWGRIEIGVGDKTYSVVVPSSLYKTGHGDAPLPQNKLSSK